MHLEVCVCVCVRVVLGGGVRTTVRKRGNPLAWLRTVCKTTTATLAWVSQPIPPNLVSENCVAAVVVVLDVVVVAPSNIVCAFMCYSGLTSKYQLTHQSHGIVPLCGLQIPLCLRVPPLPSGGPTSRRKLRP